MGFSVFLLFFFKKSETFGFPLRIKGIITYEERGERTDA